MRFWTLAATLTAVLFQIAVTTENITAEPIRAATDKPEYGWTFVGTRKSGAAPNDNIPAPVRYKGSIQLNWSNPKNEEHPFGQQQVRIVQHGRTVVNWPQAVPVYGEPTMLQVGGAEDNQIIGQDGSWLWLALKGPATPPFPSPGHYLFRYWNRIMAINVNSGVYRVFAMPGQTSPVETDSAPAFSISEAKIYVSTSEWLGVFPLDPLSVSSHQVGTLRPMPPTLFAQRQRQAEQQLYDETHAAATDIASFWDGYVMQQTVHGVPKYNYRSGPVGLWFGDGAYINHGYIPYNVLWGAEFPLVKGSVADEQRQLTLRALAVIAKNPLPSAWYVFNTGKQMRVHFHSTAPAPLPFFRISHGLYVPVTDN